MMYLLEQFIHGGRIVTDDNSDAKGAYPTMGEVKQIIGLSKDKQ